MKVVQINCVYAHGSTGRIVNALHDYIRRQGDCSFVIFGMGGKEQDENVFRAVPTIVRKTQSFASRFTGFPYGGCLLGTASVLHKLNEIKPDIVHIHCPNAYFVNVYKLLNYLKKQKITTVITNHAEFLYTGGCIYSIDCDKWLYGCGSCSKIGYEHPKSYLFDRTKQEWQLLKRSFSGFEALTVCCVSDWVRDRARRSPILRDYPIVTVLNGLDTTQFKRVDSSELKEQLDLHGRKVILHVTPDFNKPVKGGKHVIEMARRFPNVVFLIVGCEAPNDNYPDNCMFMGRTDDQKILASYYSLADLCLLPSVRETFSMVCAESLCCGTPIVGFKAGGPETISINKYSSFVEQGNDDKLADAIEEMLLRKFDNASISKEARDIYDQSIMCKKYYELYQSIVNHS